VGALDSVRKETAMSVKIRLRHTGKRNEPSHRIVVTDTRFPRDGRFIELLGIYDPRHEFEQIDLARADYWVSCGAQPSPTVSAIIRRARAGMPMGSPKAKELAAAKQAARKAVEKKEKKSGSEETEKGTAAPAPGPGSDKAAATEASDATAESKK